MNMRPILPAAVALLALSACQQKAENVSATSDDPQAAAVANVGPIELPPAIATTHTFRCKDQSLATVDFYTGDKQVTVKVDKATTPTLLKADAAGGPYKTDGYTLSGNKNGITLASPGKPEQACKA
ncbi:MAG: hypothetical protein ABIS14_04235 [Sphingomonas sp.]